MTEPATISCENENELLAALCARREALGISYETIDAIAGLSDRSACKLLTGRRPMGAVTFWLILGALGYRIRLEEDPAQLERNRRHHQWLTVKPRPSRKQWRLREIALSRRRNAPWLWTSEKASEMGRRGAMKRWSRPRVTEITKADSHGHQSMVTEIAG
jgi:hypothetical protein